MNLTASFTRRHRYSNRNISDSCWDVAAADIATLWVSQTQHKRCKDDVYWLYGLVANHVDAGQRPTARQSQARNCRLESSVATTIPEKVHCPLGTIIATTTPAERDCPL